jgi:hypothetical protein
MGSEDLREQIRAIRIAIAIVLSTGIVLGALVLVISRSSGTSKVAASQSVTDALVASAEHDRLHDAPTPEATGVRTPPIKPAVSAEELQRLNQERQSEVEKLMTADGILKARYFNSKAVILCRFMIRTREAHLGLAMDQMEARYNELLRWRPATQEDAFKRQQELSRLQFFVDGHRSNLSGCQSGFTSGFEKMPSDEEFRQNVVYSRRRIAEIDHEIATGERPVDQSTPPPQLQAPQAPQSRPEPAQPPDPNCHDVFCIPAPTVQ